MGTLVGRSPVISILAILAIIEPCLACPNHAKRVGTHCYLINSPTTVSNCLSNCKSISGHDVSVTDQDVYRSVKEAFNLATPFWAGGVYMNATLPAGWCFSKYIYDGARQLSYSTDPPLTDDQLSRISSPVNGSCLKTSTEENYTTVSCTAAVQCVCSIYLDYALCPSAYDSFGTRCLSTGQYNHTHNEAQSICQNRYGTLFEPRTKRDLEDLYPFLARNFWIYDLHLGIVYKEDAWRYKSDGEEVSAEMWDSDYPVMRLDKLCAIYNVTTKRLRNVNCDKSCSYICVQKTKPHCPPGYHSFGWSSECFFGSASKMNFTEARSYCKSYSGEISTIRITSSQTAANKVVSQAPRPPSRTYWQDVNYWTAIGYHQFPDGTMIRGIYGHRQNVPNGVFCTYMDGSFTYETNCSLVHMALCSPKFDDCPIGFLKKGSDCFYFSHGYETLPSQAIAKEYCNILSAELSWTRNSTALMEDLSVQGHKPEVIGPAVRRYWLGGLRDIATKLWSFPDDPIVNYSDSSTDLVDLWESGQPTALGECLTMNFDGQLSNKPCADLYHYICQTREGLHGMNPPMYDLPIMTPTCYEEDIFDLQFSVNPGVYDSKMISLSFCSGLCSSIKYRYAGAKYGSQCYCANSLK